MEELVEKYRENLVEKAAEQDEEVLEAYLETGEAPDVETLKKCIRKGTLSFSFVPSALWNCLQEQGRSALVGCGLRLFAFTFGCATHQGQKPQERGGGVGA